MVTNVNSSILIVGGPNDGQRENLEPTKFPTISLIIMKKMNISLVVEDIRNNSIEVQRAYYIRDTLHFCRPGEKEVQTLYFYRHDALAAEYCLHRLLNCYKPL